MKLVVRRGSAGTYASKSAADGDDLQPDAQRSATEYMLTTFWTFLEDKELSSSSCPVANAG
jgi:hypothetical protein